MLSMRIRGQTIDVDITAELERFSWTRPRWTSEKLLAASPFRYDKTPSFFVNLVTGGWKDSGAYDADWESGNFVKLLSFLRDETSEETTEYLLSEYGQEWTYGAELALPKLTLSQSDDKSISMSVLEVYKFRHPYLGKRGISERVQRLMNVGYCRENKAVTIPWYDTDGRLANIKYRKTRGKVFWYKKGAVPIRNLIYGINIVYNRKTNEAVLCEAEIDAMTWWENGKAGIAVGGVTFTNKQADIIKRSPIKHLIICTDNDKPGEKLKSQVIEKLRGYIDLSEEIIPEGYKDINEIHVSGKINTVKKRKIRKFVEIKV